MPTYKIPGPCALSWNGQNLGETLAGVQITPSLDFTPIRSDTYGDAIADAILTGKSLSVSVVGLEPSKIQGAAIDSLAHFDEIGTLAFSGSDSGSHLGKELIITERSAKYWKANISVPDDPSQLSLLSTQELRWPLTLTIYPDENGWLFYEIPDYLRSTNWTGSGR